MNWKLVLSLSCFGFVIGMIEVRGWVNFTTAYALWLVYMYVIVCAVLLVKKEKIDCFRHVFMVGLLSPVFEAIIFQAVLSEALLLGITCGLLNGFIWGLVAALVGGDSMNWKLVMLLSGFGFVLSHPAVSGFIIGYGGEGWVVAVWILAMISCAIWVAEKVPVDRYFPDFMNQFRHGLVIGFISGSMAGANLFLLISQGNAERVPDTPAPGGALAAMGFLLGATFLALPQGLLLAVFAWLAGRIAFLFAKPDPSDW